MVSYVNNSAFRATTTGIGSFTVASAVTGFQTPVAAGVVDGQSYHYRAQNADASQWEIGTALCSASGTVFTRTAIVSSNANALVNFTTIPSVALSILLAEDVPNLQGRNTYTDTTEATGAGTTASALFAGGVEIAKKLFVTGAASFGTRLAVGAADNPSAIVNVAGNALSGTGQYGMIFQPTFTAAATTGVALYAYASIPSGATLNYYGVFIENPVNAGTVTTQTQLYIATPTRGSTNYAILAPGGLVAFGGRTSISDTTASTSTTTGALIVAGGAGVDGALYVGGAISAASIITSSAIVAGGSLWSMNGNFIASNGGTGSTAAALTLLGGSGANGGGHIAFSKNVSTVTGYLGQESSVMGGGSTSHGFVLYSAGAGGGSAGRVFTTSNSDRSVAFASTTASTSHTTGALTVAGGMGIAGALNVGGVAAVAAATATPAGGSTSARLLFGTTAGFGIYYGSGAPTVSAAQGSIYIRSDGSSTATRLYANTNGTTGWTNFTSAA